MHAAFADKFEMQNRLFAELSRMFAQEVPLYDKALLVNSLCNRAVCDLLGRVHVGFTITDEQLEKTSGERHGAIRIGRSDEYRLIGRFFAAFAMEPHNYYDMSSVGAKSQPIVATAFRSRVNPEHRVFSSLLQTDYFDPATKARIEGVLAGRQVFSDKAKALLDKDERQGGLDWEDANALIAEGVGRIFKWTGRAREHGLYKDLCDAGFKIAADIACFQSHHLNHLTPNTFCIDLYTSAMKHSLGEISAAEFTARATKALDRLLVGADRDYMRLSFRHLRQEEIDGFAHASVAPGMVAELAKALTARLAQPDLDLRSLKHAGFKDTTEGPPEGVPVLLRQDAYKALTEPVVFENADGTSVQTTHTARFGEIEQRFYAATPTGRTLYDKCLTEAEDAKEKDPGLANRNPAAYEALYARPFAPFPKTLGDLLAQGLVYGRYSATTKGIADRGKIKTTNLHELVRLGYARVEGLRYEDFLPVSAAGIFASNLNQYGTKSTAAKKPEYTRAMLEEVLGRAIVDANGAYASVHAQSVRGMYADLGLWEQVPAAERSAIERACAGGQAEVAQRVPQGALA